jgi:hypothetical protein
MLVVSAVVHARGAFSGRHCSLADPPVDHAGSLRTYLYALIVLLQPCNLPFNTGCVGSRCYLCGARHSTSAASAPLHDILIVG